MASRIQDLHPDVLMLTLRHMDGLTLVVAGATCSGLRSATSDEDIWRDLCLSMWPSLAQLPFIPSYRSFFADSFPFPSSSALDPAIIPHKLISVVDLYHRGNRILSKVAETDTSSNWFRDFPFRIDILDGEEEPRHPLSVMSPEELTLSWVVIDPTNQRAVRASSGRPMAVERQWYNFGEAEVRFAVVMGEGRYMVVATVTCRKSGEVREVVLTVEDANRISVNGRNGLVILKGAMEGRRRMWDEKEARRLYMERDTINEQREKKKIQRERMLDFCSSTGQIAILMALLLYVALR